VRCPNPTGASYGISQSVIFLSVVVLVGPRQQQLGPRFGVQGQQQPQQVRRLQVVVVVIGRPRQRQRLAQPQLGLRLGQQQPLVQPQQVGTRAFS
jgi:hypothetical protein